MKLLLLAAISAALYAADPPPPTPKPTTPAPVADPLQVLKNQILTVQRDYFVAEYNVTQAETQRDKAKSAMGELYTKAFSACGALDQQFDADHVRCIAKPALTEAAKPSTK